MNRKDPQKVLDHVAVSARGIIVGVQTDTDPNSSTFGTLLNWLNPFGVKVVSVQVSGPNGSLPRRYDRVPWPYNSLINQWAFGMPKVGDYVLVGFKGGSSELPYIITTYGGSNSAAADSTAQAQRSIVPTQAIVSGVSNVIGTNPITTFLDPILPVAIPNLLPSGPNILQKLLGGL